MAKTLLLIEDSLATQQMVQAAFAHGDIDVITTTALAEALQEMQTRAPDVIVADASLPEIDGFQLCQMIRDMEGFRHLPVLLLTSGLASYDETRGAHLGVTGHLSKPFEAHALRQLVEQVLAAPSPTVSSPQRQDLSALEALMAQWMPVESSLTGPSDPPEAVVLGRVMMHILRDAVHTQLAKMLEQLAPQLLATVQDIVARQTPELLETLLQREIDQLKQAVEADDRDGE
jgi:two-component system chemotaxis response regulator CheY